MPKSISWSPIAPGFNFQHPYGNSVNPVLGDQMPSSDFHGYQAHKWCRNMHTTKILTLIKWCLTCILSFLDAYSVTVCWVLLSILVWMTYLKLRMEIKSSTFIVGDFCYPLCSLVFEAQILVQKYLMLLILDEFFSLSAYTCLFHASFCFKSTSSNMKVIYHIVWAFYLLEKLIFILLNFNREICFWDITDNWIFSYLAF